MQQKPGILPTHPPEGTNSQTRGHLIWLEATKMPQDSSISDDPGTILDSYDRVPKPSLPAAAVPAARPAKPVLEEVLYTSTYRWAAPRIVICDEHSLEEGQVFYVRSEQVTIGRAKGDVVIGHDVAMSGSHAEVVRKDTGGRYAWVLRDLGSSNGTFARARTVTLRSGITIQLGSKRYRFDLPGAAEPGTAHSGDEPGTRLLTNVGNISTEMLPALVESSPAANSASTRHPFRTTRVTIGRPHSGNNIEIDDLCLAATHAVATRDVSGAWQLEALPSLNGVWVKVDSVTLTDNCLFQCGEQRFRFRM